VLKNQLIWLRTLEEEAFGAIALPLKFSNFHDVSMPPLALQHAAQNRLVCIGGMKLAGLDRVSFDAIIHANDGTD